MPLGRQARADETRRAALVAAASLFERQGYEATTVAEIIEEAGITKGALYFHWPSKDDLGRAVLTRESEWMSSIEPSSTSPMQTAIDTTYAFIHALSDDVVLRASVRLTVERRTFQRPDQSSYRSWATAGEEVLTAARDVGQLLPHVKPRDAGMLITSALLGIQLSATAMDVRRDMRHRVHVMWQILLPGLATAETILNLRVDPPRRSKAPRAEK